MNPSPTPSPWIRLGIGISLAAVALYIVECAYYVLGPTLGGHGEPSVICIAWQFAQGKPVYPDVSAPERYGMVYGPMTSLAWGGLMWLFGPHLWLIRIAAGAMALLGLAACARVYLKLAGKTAGTLAIGYLALVYLKYTIITYYVRPDAPMMLCMALILWATFLSRRWKAWVILGVAMGWGIGLKITMPVYFLPLAVLFLRRHGIAPLIKAGVLAGVIAVLPFVLFPNISAANFIAWLTTAVDEGVEREMIVPVGGYLVLLSAPAAAVLILLALRRPAELRRLARTHKWFAIVSALCVLAVLRITGKPGAGPSHLLPLFPVLGLVVAKGLAILNAPGEVRPDARAKIVSAGGVAALVVMIAFALKGAVADVFLAYPHARGRALAAEVRALTVKYRGSDGQMDVAMGVGATREKYALARHQALVVLAGGRYLLDVPAMMDMQKAHRPIPPATLAFIREGRCRHWLIPRGEAPFEIRNWYKPEPMIFGDDFRAAFLQNYQVVEQTEHVDVWAYRPR